MTEIQNPADLTESLSKLLIELEKTTKLEQGPTLTIDDLTIPYSHLFNAKAKEMIQFKKSKLKPESSVPNVYDQVMFFSVVASKPELIYQAAQKVMKDINDLAELGYITGYLTNLSYIRLCIEGLALPCAVFCFPSISPEGIEYLDKLKASGNSLSTQVEEGDIGKRL
jgi:hypothetical protein